MASIPIMQEKNPLLQDEIMQPLVAIFLQRLPATVQKMDEAFQRSDWVTMARYAHQIKGTAGSFGYGSLTDQASTLEKCLKANDVQAVPQMFADIKYYVLGVK